MYDQSYEMRVLSRRTVVQLWKKSSPTTFSFSKNSTVCQSPMAPAASRHAVSISIAVAVMAPEDRFQHPERPVQKAQKMATKLKTKAAMTERARCRRAIMSSLNEGDDLSSSVCGK
uniref:(northern house mosquito) hypothetical protein n=1 Tax=Culex pipiens TaxID=7175 RepID=A0A8D8K0Z2_CULPI